MKFIPKVAGKSRVTFETVKEYILNKLQRDLVHRKDILTNLRKGVDSLIGLSVPVRKTAVKREMTEEQKKSNN